MEEGEDREGGQSNGNRLRAPPEESEDKILYILIAEGLSHECRIHLRCPKAFETHDAIANKSTSECGPIPPDKCNFSECRGGQKVVKGGK